MRQLQSDLRRAGGPAPLPRDLPQPPHPPPPIEGETWKVDQCTILVPRDAELPPEPVASVLQPAIARGRVAHSNFHIVVTVSGRVSSDAEMQGKMDRLQEGLLYAFRRPSKIFRTPHSYAHSANDPPIPGSAIVSYKAYGALECAPHSRLVHGHVVVLIEHTTRLHFSLEALRNLLREIPHVQASSIWYELLPKSVYVAGVVAYALKGIEPRRVWDLGLRLSPGEQVRELRDQEAVYHVLPVDATAADM